MTDLEIQDIGHELEQLQLDAKRLARRLSRLQEARGSSSSATEAQGARAFRIGDMVRIKNPNRLQPIRGKVTKISPKRITVTSASGTTVVRAPKNVEVME